MSSHNRKSPGTLVAIAAVVAVFASGASLAARAEEYGGHARRTLEGTWWVTVTALSDCQSRVPVGSFVAMLTFAPGGTLTGTTTNPVFAAGQRGPDHGVWARAGAHTYHASSAAFLLFTTAPNLPVAPGFQAGSQRLDQTITLNGADHFKSDAITQFFDTSGRKYREGCATAAAYRFE